MPGKLVSICVPNLDMERWPGAAIKSALVQAHRNIEVIVVDNDSKDGSWEVRAS